MKNICFLNSTKFWGGGEKIHLDYSAKFKEKNYNVFLGVKENSPLDLRAKQAGINTHYVTLTNLSFLNPFKYFNLISFFKSAKIDTVIISSSHDLKTGAIAAKLAGVKKIVYYRALATPVKNRWLNRLIFGKVLTHIVANSEETKKTLLQNLSNIVNADDVKVVYQGLDIDAIDKQKINPPFDKTNVVTIGNAGRLTRQKGQHHLIEIAKILKSNAFQFKMVIAGTGELFEELNSKIKENNLQNEFQLLGFVEDINSFMHSIDIFVLTSEWEGFGYVLTEAMIAKKPLVAFDITSNPELIENGKNGFLVKYPDTKAFAEKLGLLIKDESLRKNFGESGRSLAEKNFTLDKIINDFERGIYDTCR